jgi:hypothetical protein
VAGAFACTGPELGQYRHSCAKCKRPFVERSEILRELCENTCMARGWESKDVEAQVESKDGKSSSSGHGSKSPEQQLHEQDIQQLQLSRTRIVNDLKSATHPNHRKSLEAALAHLDKKIADLS